MLHIVSGDLFASRASAIVNTVNCVGVMGKGIALAFKQRYPEIMPPYVKACRDGALRPGLMQFILAHDGRWVVNFPTKDHWRNPSRLDWIESGLLMLASELSERGIPSVAIPALGCTNGGLSFDDVRPLVEDVFDDIPIEAWLYEPQQIPAATR